MNHDSHGKDGFMDDDPEHHNYENNYDYDKYDYEGDEYDYGYDNNHESSGWWIEQLSAFLDVSSCGMMSLILPNDVPMSAAFWIDQCKSAFQMYFTCTLLIANLLFRIQSSRHYWDV